MLWFSVVIMLCPSCYAYHVMPIMLCPSCYAHHVMPIMLCPSCYAHHVMPMPIQYVHAANSHSSTADAWLKKKFQVAGRTTFCHLFFINPYVIGTQKLPVASPKNMYNL